MRHALRSDINVTPFVDVVLVLLIIFMVVTPKLLERVTLPVVDHPDERKPPPGQVRLFVDWPAGAVWIDDRRYEDGLALETLTEIHSKSPKKELVLFADTRLDVGALKRAIHMADAAGYKGVGLIALKTPKK